MSIRRCLLWTISLALFSAAASAATPGDPAFRLRAQSGASGCAQIAIDRDALLATSGKTLLALPACRGASTTARAVRASRRPDGRVVWTARVDTPLGPQSAVIVAGDDASFGTIPRADGHRTLIATNAAGTWLLDDEGERPANRERDFAIPPRAAATAAAAPARPATGKDGSVAIAAAPIVDVLVLYNDSMVAQFGSTSAVLTRIAYLEAISNQAYVDSGANTQIHVVAAQPLDYQANNDNSVALGEITNASALPAKADVDAMREAYAADLVLLLRAYDPLTQTSGGNGWLNGYHGNGTGFSPGYGFSVVSDCAPGGRFYCSGYAFPHELGHNMGLHHDTETAGGDFGAYPWSRGFRQSVAGASFFTIMAYRVAGQSEVGRFSSPLISCTGGAPCGTASDADNARSLADSSATVAAFRAAMGPPTLRIDDVATAEGDAGTHQVTLTLSLSRATGFPVTFDIATGSGTASAGTDYVAAAAVGRTIPAGATTATFTVTVNGDAATELDETVPVAVTNVGGAVLVGGGAVLTIVDDDQPTLSVADVSAPEAAGALVFTFSLSGPAPYPVSFQAWPSLGTADSGDVNWQAKVLTIAPGDTSAQFTVQVFDDIQVEPNETVFITAQNITRAKPGKVQATGTILNDDQPWLSAGNLFVTEGQSGTTWAMVKVTLSTAVAWPVTFDVATSDIASSNAATAVSDYAPVDQHGLVIPAGQTTVTIPIAIVTDDVREADELFRVDVANVVGAKAGNFAYVCIVNDDFNGPLPALSISDMRIAEGQSGQTTGSFTVSIPAPFTQPVYFDLAIEEGSATLWSDFQPISGITQYIPIGQTSITYDVAITGDTEIEADETFAVSLRNVENGAIARGSARGTIVNDDLAALSIGDVTVTEGGSAGTTATFEVSLPQPMSGPVRFDVATVAGSAAAGSDFVALAQSGRILDAGRTRALVEVRIVGDAVHENPEAFTVVLSNVTGASLADGSGKATILDDDASSLVAIADVQGAGSRSPLEGTAATVEGVVTATTRDGYFLQAAGADARGGGRRSDALFVRAPAPRARSGERWRVSGTVREWPLGIDGDGDTAGAAAIDDAMTTIVADAQARLASAAPLPAAAPLDGRAGLAGDQAWREMHEGMRVQLGAARVVGPSGGTIDPVRLVAHGDGRFHVMPSRVATTPWAIRAPADAATSADAGDRFAGGTGALASESDLPTVWLEQVPVIASGIAPQSAPPAKADEARIARIDLRDLRDDRSGRGGARTRSTAYARQLAKAANLVCAYAQSPDVVILSGIGDPAVARDLAQALAGNDGNLLFPGACAAAPQYEARSLARGVALLLRGPSAASGVRTRVVGDETAGRGTPSLAMRVLRLRMDAANGRSLDLAVALAALPEPTGRKDAAPARGVAARALQTWLQERQVRLPSEPLLVFANSGPSAAVGPWSAPAIESADPLVDLVADLPAGAAYSLRRDGRALTTDRVFASPALLRAVPGTHVRFARLNADAAEDHLGDADTPLRVSDRDPILVGLPLR